MNTFLPLNSPHPTPLLPFPPTQDGATPSYIAAHNGHAEALTVLRDGGANLDTPDEVRASEAESPSAF